MKRIVLIAIVLSGCATTSGVIPEGKDAYLIIMSGGHGLSSSLDLKIAAHQQAGAFCTGLNKRVETVTEKTIQAGTQSDFSEDELKFRCIAGIDAPVVTGDAH